MAERFPWINTEDLVAGSLGLRHEGWLDPYSLLQAFRRKAMALGADYAKDTVLAIERQGGRAMSVRLAEGGTISCGIVVNAAGPQAGAVAALPASICRCGRRSASSTSSIAAPKVPCANLVIDPSGVFFRPEGRNFLCGVSPPEDQDPDCDDFEIDYAMFDDIVWPALANRVPAFAELKVQSAWAGLYDYNTFDQNAIIGAIPASKTCI